MIAARIIADSIAPNGVRLTTFQICFQRFILPEFNTHRRFSRNASSSRAIPTKTLLAQVFNDPAFPISFGQNQPGMQAGAELVGWRLTAAKLVWGLSAKSASLSARLLGALGVHKQTANRVVEPYTWSHVIVSSTDWENFFELRCHKDAQPEIRQLAELMREALAASKPIYCTGGDWHLPYITDQERIDYPTRDLIKMSAARCARVSYLTHDGKNPSREKDLALYDRLVGSVPIHASPVEHQATPLLGSTEKGGNFNGWHQHRQDVEALHYALPPASK